MTFLGENGCFLPCNPNNPQRYSQHIYYNIGRSNERKIEFDLQTTNCCCLRDYAQMLSDNSLDKCSNLSNVFGSLINLIFICIINFAGLEEIRIKGERNLRYKIWNYDVN
uniref:Uncharacterized protein n=1 Tax=Glossina austeni TaxID=7395 RepID=A0A1A9VXR2_GLOAU